MQKPVKQRRTDVISFCMQFEKGGRGLLREAFRNEGESVGSGKSDGEKMKLFKKCLSADRRRYRWMVGWVGSL